MSKKKWALLASDINEMAATFRQEGEPPLRDDQLRSAVHKAGETLRDREDHIDLLESALGNLYALVRDRLQRQGGAIEGTVQAQVEAAISASPRRLYDLRSGEWIPLADVVVALDGILSTAWGGAADMKYVGLRIDTRDMQCWVTNRHGDACGREGLVRLVEANERHKRWLEGFDDDHKDG